MLKDYHQIYLQNKEEVYATLTKSSTQEVRDWDVNHVIFNEFLYKNNKFNDLYVAIINDAIVHVLDRIKRYTYESYGNLDNLTMKFFCIQDTSLWKNTELNRKYS